MLLIGSQMRGIITFSETVLSLSGTPWRHWNRLLFLRQPPVRVTIVIFLSVCFIAVPISVSSDSSVGLDFLNGRTKPETQTVVLAGDNRGSVKLISVKVKWIHKLREITRMFPTSLKLDTAPDSASFDSECILIDDSWLGSLLTAQPLGDVVRRQSPVVITYWEGTFSNTFCWMEM